MKIAIRTALALIIGLGTGEHIKAMESNENATEESSSCLKSTRGAQQQFDLLKKKINEQTLSRTDLQSYPWNEKAIHCALKTLFNEYKETFVHEITMVLQSAGILTTGFPREFHPTSQRPVSWKQYEFAEACLAILETFEHPGSMELLRLSSGLQKLRDRLVATEAASAVRALRESWSTSSGEDTID